MSLMESMMRAHMSAANARAHNRIAESDGFKMIRPRTWRHASGVEIWLPCDKKTYRVSNADGRTFRTWKSAVRAALANKPS